MLAEIKSDPAKTAEEAEIDALAANVRAAISNYVPTTNGVQSTQAQAPTAATDSAADTDSSAGKFGWATVLEDILLPFIKWNNEDYVAARMIQESILPNVEKKVGGEVIKCWKFADYKIEEKEATLLNEINQEHCDGMFGDHTFQKGDIVLKLSALKGFLEFIEICSNVIIIGKHVTNQLFGFLQINSENAVPFVWDGLRQLVPLFYFDGQSNYLDEKSEQLTDPVKLCYLQFCCKVQKIKPDFYEHKSITVVDLDEIKKLFSNDTKFEPYCPKEINKDLFPAENTQNTIVGAPLTVNVSVRVDMQSQPLVNNSPITKTTDSNGVYSTQGQIGVASTYQQSQVAPVSNNNISYNPYTNASLSQYYMPQMYYSNGYSNSSWPQSVAPVRSSPLQETPASTISSQAPNWGILPAVSQQSCNYSENFLPHHLPNLYESSAPYSSQSVPISSESATPRVPSINIVAGNNHRQNNLSNGNTNQSPNLDRPTQNKQAKISKRGRSRNNGSNPSKIAKRNPQTVSSQTNVQMTSNQAQFSQNTNNFEQLYASPNHSQHLHPNMNDPITVINNQRSIEINRINQTVNINNNYFQINNTGLSTATTTTYPQINLPNVTPTSINDIPAINNNNNNIFNTNYIEIYDKQHNNTPAPFNQYKVVSVRIEVFRQYKAINYIKSLNSSFPCWIPFEEIYEGFKNCKKDFVGKAIESLHLQCKFLPKELSNMWTRETRRTQGISSTYKPSLPFENDRSLNNIFHILQHRIEREEDESVRNYVLNYASNS